MDYRTRQYLHLFPDFQSLFPNCFGRHAYLSWATIFRKKDDLTACTVRTCKRLYHFLIFHIVTYNNVWHPFLCIPWLVNIVSKNYAISSFLFHTLFISCLFLHQPRTFTNITLLKNLTIIFHMTSWCSVKQTVADIE